MVMLMFVGANCSCSGVKVELSTEKHSILYSVYSIICPVLGIVVPTAILSDGPGGQTVVLVLTIDWLTRFCQSD